MDNFGLDEFASRAIYKDFISGKVINAYDYINGELQPSHKFRELVDNLDKYRDFYSLIGFEIRSVNNDAFFVSRSDRTEELNEVAANIQVLLLMVGRGLCTQGTSPGILFDDKGGVSAKDIDAIGELEEVRQIMKACRLQQPLTKPVNSIMVERGIFHKTVQERYILSSAGRIFFNELFVNDASQQTIHSSEE
ncbi:DNA gyrase [Endozoicomonas sp. (ex Bugula neritina AB1)]|nr:DNA gyrase [Endozoicomonas sp. (ex Bugula neritina AB1)]